MQKNLHRCLRGVKSKDATSRSISPPEKTFWEGLNVFGTVYNSRRVGLVWKYVTGGRFQA